MPPSLDFHDHSYVTMTSQLIRPMARCRHEGKQTTASASILRQTKWKRGAHSEIVVVVPVCVCRNSLIACLTSSGKRGSCESLLSAELCVKAIRQFVVTHKMLCPENTLKQVRLLVFLQWNITAHRLGRNVFYVIRTVGNVKR